jgi:hypothetical protein
VLAQGRAPHAQVDAAARELERHVDAERQRERRVRAPRLSGRGLDRFT